MFDETDLLYLRDEVFARRSVQMSVFLAGDNHHYRRHQEIDPAEPQAPIQKITAGGGGAFLHPTHDEDVSLLEEERAMPDEPRRRYGLAASYPDVAQSARLAFGNLLFAWHNPKFGIIPAALYVMTIWMVSATMTHPRPSGAGEAATLTMRAFDHNPALALWIVALFGTFVTFTDTHSRIYRVLGGTVHLAAHAAAMFAVGWGALAAAGWLAPPWPSARFGVVAVLAMTGGWLAGSFLTGLYLLVSLNVFGRHSEEAFSALRIQDYKNFLRLHVAADGTLTIYPIKLPRVPRRWRRRTGGLCPHPRAPRTRRAARTRADRAADRAAKRMSGDLVLPPDPAATYSVQTSTTLPSWASWSTSNPGPAASMSFTEIFSPRRRNVSWPIFTSALPGDSRTTQNGTVIRRRRFSRGSKARTWRESMTASPVALRRTTWARSCSSIAMSGAWPAKRLRTAASSSEAR